MIWTRLKTTLITAIVLVNYSRRAFAVEAKEEMTLAPTTLGISATTLSDWDDGSGDDEFQLISSNESDKKNTTREALKSDATENEPVVVPSSPSAFVPVSIKPRSPTSNDLDWPTTEHPQWEREYRKHKDNGRVQHIEAECQDDFMKIRVGFNGSFHGLVYSAGYAYDPDCMYINGSGRDYYEFYIQLNRCGTLGRNMQLEAGKKNPTNLMWNTITVQYNSLIEEDLDEHFKVTCEYGYDFWKTVTFPFLDVEVATGNPVVFTLQPPECYMEIRSGFGAAGARVAGPVRVGDPLTLVIYMRSAYDGFDIVVNDCYAHNGANKRIQLIDENGCPIDDKLISRFRGSWSDAGVFETQVYAYMKTFRFTGSPALYIECDVRMCHGRCPTQPCHWRNMKSVKKRSIESEIQSTKSQIAPTGDIPAKSNVKSAVGSGALSENINLFQSLRVLQEGEEDTEKTPITVPRSENLETCMKTSVLSTILASGCLVLCLLSGSLLVAWSKLRSERKPCHVEHLYDTYVHHKGRIK